MRFALVCLLALGCDAPPACDACDDGGTDAPIAIDGGGDDAGRDVGLTDVPSGDDGGIDGGGGETDGGIADAGGVGTDAPATMAGDWSDPISLVDDIGRLAIGNDVHVVGHLDGDLVHLRSGDDGVTWDPPNTIAPAAGNFPAMYGGLVAQGDELLLITGDDDLASGPRQLDFRRSTDSGRTFGAPVRITTPSQPIFRARIGVSGTTVHVVGTASPTTSGVVVYFRSTDSGRTWETPRVLASDLGPYGGGQTVAVDGDTVHVGYTLAVDGPGGGPALYIRSTDGGRTFSAPVDIGEPGARQARVQIVAADGHVFVCWQREASMTGLPVPADRLGYNRSADGGVTWAGAVILPGDTGVDRNHQQVWMSSGGDVHFLWRHGDTTADPAGYLRSRDYGATWEPRLFAVDTGEINHPYAIVADADAVHVLTAPLGRMLYARRPLR